MDPWTDTDTSVLDFPVETDPAPDTSGNPESTDESHQPDDAADAPGAAKAPAPRAGGPDRRTIRRVAAKALAFQKAPSAVRTLAAQVLATNDDPLDMTVAVFASNNPSSVISDLLSVADQDDPFDAMATAAVLADKNRIAAPWQLALSLKLTLPDRPPATDAKAGSAFARAVVSLDAASRQRLTDVAELLKRG